MPFGLNQPGEESLFIRNVAARNIGLYFMFHWLPFGFRYQTHFSLFTPFYYLLRCFVPLTDFSMEASEASPPPSHRGAFRSEANITEPFSPFFAPPNWIPTTTASLPGWKNRRLRFKLVSARSCVVSFFRISFFTRLNDFEKRNQRNVSHLFACFLFIHWK